MVIKEGKFGRSVLTSVWLNIDDYTFCKTNRIKFSELMRSAIKKAQEQILNTGETDNKKIERLRETIKDMSKFLDDKKLLDVYCEEKK